MTIIFSALIGGIAGLLAGIYAVRRKIALPDKARKEPDKTADIIHELKQPLNVTKIICQSILQDIQKDRLQTQELKGDLQEIVNQMNKMSEIVLRIRVENQKEKDNGTAQR